MQDHFELSKSDLYLALLDHHNTPTEQTNLSPAQRLYGHRTRTLLPLSPTLLQPELQPVGLKIAAGQAKQAKHYNRTAKPLEEIQSGQSVRVKLPGDDKWSLGTCKQEVGPRSYLVECGGKTYRCNHQHLKTTPEEKSTMTHWEPDTEADNTSGEGEHIENPVDFESTIANTDTTSSDNNEQTMPQSSQLRTSSFGRVIRQPKQYTEEYGN